MRTFLSRLFFWFWYLRKPPWDTGVSPPELLDLINSRPPGRALDLGCGTGTNVITLARHGWEASGVDFVAAAISRGRRKAHAAGLEVDLRRGDVTRLEGFTAPYDLILDIGCLHGLPQDRRYAYHGQIKRLLAPGGVYLLYAFTKPSDESGPGLTEAEIADLARDLQLIARKDTSERGRRPSLWLTFTTT